MDLVHGVGLGETERMVVFLEERRHFFDIPCVVIFKDHSCFVVSENRGIKPSLLALVSLRRQPGRGQVKQPLSSGHETPNFQLREERNAREGEIPLSNTTAS